jgi:hypothetical protein
MGVAAHHFRHPDRAPAFAGEAQPRGDSTMVEIVEGRGADGMLRRFRPAL